MIVPSTNTNAPIWVIPQQFPCPSCGHCPHCGRSGPTIAPYPSYPYQPTIIYC